MEKILLLGLVCYLHSESPGTCEHNNTWFRGNIESCFLYRIVFLSSCMLFFVVFTFTRTLNPKKFPLRFHIPPISGVVDVRKFRVLFPQCYTNWDFSHYCVTKVFDWSIFVSFLIHLIERDGKIKKRQGAQKCALQSSSN